MTSSKTKILVTGGCGFIGSHLITALMQKDVDIVVLDNLTTGSVENIKKWLHKPNFRFLKGDLLNETAIKDAIKGRELVLHLAANPEIRIGVEDTRKDLEQNILATYNLLEAMRRRPNAHPRKLCSLIPHLPLRSLKTVVRSPDFCLLLGHWTRHI